MTPAFRRCILFFLLFLMGISAGTVSAETRDTQQENTVTAGQVIDRSVFLSGDLVQVDGTVKGDLFAAGRTIVINGVVEGDVFGAANDVVVNGKVLGDVRLAGRSVSLKGEIRHNGLIFAQYLTAFPQSSINGELTTFIEGASLSGEIGKHLQGAGQSFDITGKIGGNVELYGVEHLAIQPGAKVAGSLQYKAPKEGQIAQGTVEGPVDFTLEPTESDIAKENKSSFPYFGLLGFLSTLALWLIVRTAFRRGVAAVNQQLEQSLLANLGKGALFSLAIPFACILLVITLIGIPIAVLLGVITIMLWYLSKIFIGIWVGNWIARRWNARSVWKELIGLIIIYVLIHLPYVGWMVGMAAAMLFLGGLISTIWRPAKV